MNYVLIAVSWCLLAQQPSSDADPFDAIPIAPRQPAPAADMDIPDAAPAEDAPPADSAPAEPPAEPPGDLAPTGNAWDDPPTADGSLARPDPHDATTEPPATEMEPLGQRPPQKLRPPELIAEALENPQQEALEGTPLSMSQALARARDRGTQLRIAQAYWSLAAAQAKYHWALKQRAAVTTHTGSHANQAGAAGALASAEADVRDAQLGVGQAQQQLADLLGPAAMQELPLAVDRPHVGDYRMQYESIFSGRAVPPRIQLIHRTLPVRRKAIDAHGAAIVAALDAVDASGAEFEVSGRGLSTLLGSIDLLKRERQAFVEQVRQYNLEIAEYAFAVAPAGAPSDTLVSMLIRTSPAGGEQAPRKTLRNPVPPDGAALDRSTNWSSNYPDDVDATVADDPATYQALLSVAHHPLRVQKLGDLLHWDRNLPPDAGAPVALAECLRGVSVPNRLAVIDAYWRTRECAARFQLLAEVQEQLTTLQSIAIAQRGDPGMAEAGVRLHAARGAAKAATLDAELALTQAQFDLTGLAGRSLAETWLLPSTPPQSGRYVVKRSPRATRWAEMTTLEYDKLQHRADAVIQSDAHRAELVVLARQGEAAGGEEMTPLDRAIAATWRQNAQTLEFLDNLTEYNMAIARFALSVLPPNMPGDELASKLAIARSTLRDS